MNAPAWYGAFAAASALLVVGGALKAVRPNETANALTALRIPGGRALVRLGGATETAVGVAALAVGGRLTATLVAGSYVGFTIFVLAAMRGGTPVGSCGCFGEVDAPPTILHVLLTAGAATGAVLTVTVDRAPGLAGVLAHQPGNGFPLLALVGVAGYAAFLVMAVLPRTISLARDRP